MKAGGFYTGFWKKLCNTQLQLILVDRKDLEDKGGQGGQGGKKVLPMNATWYNTLYPALSCCAYKLH
ncbi:MAG TPA: hypothetical protein DEG47_17145 [Cyanobacteria bacterium UBA11148]|nr:hypothetical protein [Cyanobacteria bacterium UBA11148]